MNVGGSGDEKVDQARVLVHSHGDLHAEGALVALPGRVHLRIVLAGLVFDGAGGRDQSGIQNYPLPFSRELAGFSRFSLAEKPNAVHVLEEVAVVPGGAHTRGCFCCSLRQETRQEPADEEGVGSGRVQQVRKGG
jgi:hypothetical protein